MPPPPAGPLGSGGFGAPLQTGAPVTPGSSAAKKRNPLPWIIGAVVLVIAAIVVIVLLVAGGDDDAGVDGEGAAAGFSAVVDDVDFQDAETSDLRRCPMGDAAELTEQIAEQIDASDDLIDGDESSFVADESEFGPLAIICSLSVSDDVRGPSSVIYIANAVPRGDYADFIEDVFGDDADVDVDDPVGYAGGQIYSYCGRAEGNEVSCGADWVDEDNDIVLGVNAFDQRIDGEDAVDALKTVLEQMADGLAAEA